MIKTHKQAIILLLVVGACAWWPVLEARPLVADDYPHSGLLSQGFGAYWQKYGLWRCVGHTLPIYARELLPRGDALLALITHFATIPLLFIVACSAGGSRSLAAGITLIWASLPFGFQAVTWNAAYTFLGATPLTLGVLAIALRPPNDPECWALAGASAVLTFLALCNSESVILILMTIAGYCFFARFIRLAHAGSLSLALATAGACFLWFAIHKATAPPSFHKTIDFYPTSIAAGFLRQTFQRHYFTAIPSLLPWASWTTWLSVAIAATATSLAVFNGCRADKETNGSLHSWHKPSFWLLLALPVSAVSIYALGGGFSNDSRKAYAIWPYFLLAVIPILQMINVRSFLLPRLFPLALVATLTLLTLSTGLTIRFWSVAATQANAIYDELAGQNPTLPYVIQLNPDPYLTWPAFDRLCGFRFDSQWVINAAMGQRYHSQIPNHKK